MRHNEQAVDSTHHAHHIMPVSTYLKVIIILMALTGITVWVAFRDFSHIWSLANLFLALGIATVKAAIVTWYFMHVKYSGKLVKLIIFTSLTFMFLMIFGVLMDQYTRHGVKAAGYTTVPEYELLHSSEILSDKH